MKLESPAWSGAGGGLVLAGITVSLWGVHAFRRARTTVNPTRPGSSTVLVVSGVYRFTRNPMYLGFLLMLLGAAAQLENAAAFIVWPAFVLYLNRFQIRPEEEALRALFGEAFIRYQSRVRRWL